MDINNKNILDDCNSDLKKIKDWIDNNPLDSKVKYLVQYAIIKSSGSIERVFKSIIHTYLSQNCISETRQFLEKNIIDSSANPSFGKIKQFLDQFDGSKANEFDERLKNTTEKGNLNSLVTLRNDIAHGRSINQTINDVEKYFKSGLKVLDVLDEILK